MKDNQLQSAALVVGLYQSPGPVAAANNVKGLVAAVVGSQSWCPLRDRQRNLSRGSVPQDVPPSLLATVLSM